ncbi:hypothetical protein N7465_001826 [Penicillium sp. CMV-2018d]|nr:hypothetical protein N7465_001826 [Penicillium sp. CMV-2018d]
MMRRQTRSMTAEPGSGFADAFSELMRGGPTQTVVPGNASRIVQAFCDKEPGSFDDELRSAAAIEGWASKMKDLYIDL